MNIFYFIYFWRIIPLEISFLYAKGPLRSPPLLDYVISMGYGVFCVHIFYSGSIFVQQETCWTFATTLKIKTIIIIIMPKIFVIVWSEHMVSIVIFSVIELWISIFVEVSLWGACTGSSMGTIPRVLFELYPTNEEVALQSNHSAA